MSEQQHRPSGRAQQQARSADQADEQVHAMTRPTHDAAAFDALLDEIDGVLEGNAEDYVRGFVQKGGQ